MQSVNWDYVKNNPGTYRLVDSRELFFVSNGKEVHYWIPDEQQFDLLINHNFWAQSKFTVVEGKESKVDGQPIYEVM